MSKSELKFLVDAGVENKVESFLLKATFKSLDTMIFRNPDNTNIADIR